jgi:hypothetical protein
MTYKQNWKEHLNSMNSDHLRKQILTVWQRKERCGQSRKRWSWGSSRMFVPLPNCTASHPNTLKSVIWSSYKHSISENGSVLIIRNKYGRSSSYSVGSIRSLVQWQTSRYMEPNSVKMLHSGAAPPLFIALERGGRCFRSWFICCVLSAPRGRLGCPSCNLMQW